MRQCRGKGKVSTGGELCKETTNIRKTMKPDRN